MRQRKLINTNWEFTKSKVGKESNILWDKVELPHTWNAIDGQDGGNDYHRGTCWYSKNLSGLDFNENEDIFLEFNGVNSSAEIYLNDELLAKHDGGYSTFRVKITDYLKEENNLLVSVDNSKNNYVYPQKADFTFYGGIYRDVFLIKVPKERFSLEYYGGTGIKVTSDIIGGNANVLLEVFTENVQDGETVEFVMSNGLTATATIKDNRASTTIEIKNVHLWNGIEDPYLYSVTATLTSSRDEISAQFGCRTFKVDKDKGFILNGNEYRLCGAARHQDRQGVGNAITTVMQDEDMEIMKEMGVNTIRLAHYQHDQYFYDLCDKEGMIVWAEIPYITEHLPNGVENTISQMTELVVQNYNHPSIICWGLSNEITATGGPSEEITINHQKLNDLCHKYDKSRPTTMAHVFMLDSTDPLVQLPDISSFNLYYGWYLGEKEENDEWFDNFRVKVPNTAIGLSEFGADANPAFQSRVGEKGDWSETYQALYHEHMLKMWSERPYMWAMHVWNMFDFGADGRDEGGKPGQNQKGLVTFDRKLKKDAFYIYKAYLSKEPFVHITGQRYVERTGEKTEIKVYSNQNEVTLYVDGKEFKSIKSEKVFIFEVEIIGNHSIQARSGDLIHEINIKKVNESNKTYLKDPDKIVNWFDREDMQIRDGYFSIKDSIKDIKSNPEANKLLEAINEIAIAAYGDVAKNIQLPPEMVERAEKMSAEATFAQASKVITPEMIIEFNRKLNSIKK